LGAVHVLRWARWRWGFAAYLGLGRYVVRVKLSLTRPREFALVLARRGEPWRLGVERHEHPACGGRLALHLHLGRCRSLVKCGWGILVYQERWCRA